MEDKKNKLDIVKIKGIIGLLLFISLIIIGKLAKFYEIAANDRYWGGEYYYYLLEGLQFGLCKIGLNVGLDKINKGSRDNNLSKLHL